MKITEVQLRRVVKNIIREQTESVPDPLMTGQQITSWEQLDSLKPGDQLERNGQKITFMSLDDDTIIYTDSGKSIRKHFDVRDYLDWGDGETTGDVLKFIGAGQPPVRTRLPPRKRGPGFSYSIYD